jgi:acetyl esterase/lipase
MAEDGMRLWSQIWVMAVLCVAMAHWSAQAAPSAPAKPPAAAQPAKLPNPPARSAARPQKPLTHTAKTGSTKIAEKKPAPKTQISYPDGVTAQRDLIYSALPGFRPLALDIYQPKPARKDFPKPVVIFVHGGAWNSGDNRHSATLDDLPETLAALAADNYVVASVDYRLSGEAHFPAALQDVKSAIRWLRGHAADYGIDTTRVAIWGEEAGGQLAALAGTSCGVSALEPPAGTDKPASDCVDAVIGWDTINDLTASAAGRNHEAAHPSPEGAYLGCEPADCAPGLARTATPAAFVGPNSPSFLLQQISGSSVMQAQSQSLYDTLNQAHVPVELAGTASTGPDAVESALARIVDFLAKTFPRRTGTAPPPPPKSGALPY